MLTDMADAEDTILALGLCSAVHTKEMYLPQEVLDGAHFLTSCHTDKALTLACMHACMPAACSTEPVELLFEIFCVPEVRRALCEM